MATDIQTLSDITVDVDQFVTQMENAVATKATWIGNLTTQTSQTLIELIATVGTFDRARILRAYENAFSETATSDDAIRSIAQMQGIRMSRKLPAGLTANLTSNATLTLSPLTQFLIGGQYYFCRDQLNLIANVAYPATLFQGQIQSVTSPGIGSDNQTFVSPEDSFAVSDLDVQVLINGTIIPKALGGLWNYKGLPAYSDLTTADGRLMVVFGTALYGSAPGTNDVVTINYPLTDGATSDNQTLLNKPVSVTGFSGITGVVTANPTGGADDKSVLAYKNLGSGSFGTFLSSVTKSQYSAAVIVYPGIIDAVTQAQREINPSALQWMNVIRVSGLPNSPWTQQQKSDFCAYMQTVTMYAPHFIWVDAIPIPRDVVMDAYCFNTTVLTEAQQLITQAVVDLFNPRPGILMTNFYEYDLMNVGRDAANGGVSYIIVSSPNYPMIVTAPPSPLPQYALIAGGGSLGQYQYSYGISTVNTAGEEGPPTNWVYPQVTSTTANYAIQLTWQPVGDAAIYHIWGRKAGAIGLIASISASSPLTFTDDGSVTPTGSPPNAISEVPIRYNQLRSLTVNMHYAERQQRVDSADNPTRSNI